VHISTNNGQSWQNISAGLPNRWVTKVAADPFDAQTIYATLSGFRWSEPLPHVFKSTNLGSSWTEISGNLPEFPVNDIALDPDIPGRIIVATDAGVYGTADGGQNWSWIWNDLPAVPVYCFKIHPPTRTIVAGTYGLSCYKANLDLIFEGIPASLKSRTVNLTVNPNPVINTAKLNFFLPGPDNIRICVYGMNGELRQEVFSGNLPAGSQQISWTPGRLGEKGQAAAPGVYFVRLEGKQYSATAKVLRY